MILGKTSGKKGPDHTILQNCYRSDDPRMGMGNEANLLEMLGRACELLAKERAQLSASTCYGSRYGGTELRHFDLSYRCHILAESLNFKLVTVEGHARLHMT
jgi:hypothetical protein